MPRLRTLKPSFFSNDLLAEVEPLGRLLFAGLWCIADRRGRLEDRPKRIGAEVLPYDKADVELLLTALAARGFIVRYGMKGQQYIQITNFGKHQSPHIKEPESIIPPPDGYGASMVLIPGIPQASNPPSHVGSGELSSVVGSGELSSVVGREEDSAKQVSHPPTGKKEQWTPPDFFGSLLALPGYRKGNHQDQADKILAGCVEAGVQAQMVVDTFATYYLEYRADHKWKDPVKALGRTLAIQISKVRNGHDGEAKRASQADHGGKGDSPFAEYSR